MDGFSGTEAGDDAGDGQLRGPRTQRFAPPDKRDRAVLPTPDKRPRAARPIHSRLGPITSIVDFHDRDCRWGPQLMRTMHIGPAQFGLIVSSYTFAAGVAAGCVDDRRSFARRTTFMCSTRVLVGTFCFCALAPNYALAGGSTRCHRASAALTGRQCRWRSSWRNVFPEERRSGRDPPGSAESERLYH